MRKCYGHIWIKQHSRTTYCVGDQRLYCSEQRMEVVVLDLHGNSWRILDPRGGKPFDVELKPRSSPSNQHCCQSAMRSQISSWLTHIANPPGDPPYHHPRQENQACPQSHAKARSSGGFEYPRCQRGREERLTYPLRHHPYPALPLSFH